MCNYVFSSAKEIRFKWKIILITQLPPIDVPSVLVVQFL